MAQVDILTPEDCTDKKKKRALLQNIQQVQGIAHLLQSCRDQKDWSYDDSVNNLRQNAVKLERTNTARTPTQLMHVEAPL